MATLKDHSGREIKNKKFGDMVMYWIDSKYFVIVNKHTPLREVVSIMDKFYE